MKKTKITPLAVLFVCAVMMVSLASAMEPPSVAELKEIYPQMEVDSIRESEIPGLYEITAGNNIIYFYPEKNYLLFGEIVTKEGKNLTAEKRNLNLTKKMEKIDLENALKIGSGKIRVVEITDPDCGYCRKLSKYFEKPEIKEKITRYVMFASFRPQSLEKAEYIMSASNGEAAYIEVMSGKMDKVNPGEFTVTKRGGDLVKKQKEFLTGLRIQGTPTLLINGEVVVGADMEKIERALKKNR